MSKNSLQKHQLQLKFFWNVCVGMSCHEWQLVNLPMKLVDSELSPKKKNCILSHAKIKLTSEVNFSSILNLLQFEMIKDLKNSNLAYNLIWDTIPCKWTGLHTHCSLLFQNLYFSFPGSQDFFFCLFFCQSITTCKPLQKRVTNMGFNWRVFNMLSGFFFPTKQ